MHSSYADSPAVVIGGMSSSMKNAGLERPDSCWDRVLSCLDGGLTMGGRRG